MNEITKAALERAITAGREFSKTVVKWEVHGLISEEQFEEITVLVGELVAAEKALQTAIFKDDGTK
jgi:hypothetical protein